MLQVVFESNCRMLLKYRGTFLQVISKTSCVFARRAQPNEAIFHIFRFNFILEEIASLRSQRHIKKVFLRQVVGKRR